MKTESSDIQAASGQDLEPEASAIVNIDDVQLVSPSFVHPHPLCEKDLLQPAGMLQDLFICFRNDFYPLLPLQVCFSFLNIYNASPVPTSAKRG